MEKIKVKATALRKYVELTHSETTPNEIDTLLKFYCDVYQAALKDEFKANLDNYLTKEIVEEDYMFFNFIHDFQLIVAYTKNVEDGRFVYTIENIAYAGTNEVLALRLRDMVEFLTRNNMENAQQREDLAEEILELEEELENLEEEITDLIDRKEFLEQKKNNLEEELDDLEEIEFIEMPSLYKTVFLHEEECDCECGCDCKCKH